MSNVIIKPDKIEFHPPTQKTIAFGANNGLFGICPMINTWLEENPQARIVQMIQTGNCVLCLYEFSEVAIKSE